MYLFGVNCSLKEVIVSLPLEIKELCQSTKKNVNIGRNSLEYCTSIFIEKIFPELIKYCNYSPQLKKHSLPNNINTELEILITSLDYKKAMCADTLVHLLSYCKYLNSEQMDKNTFFNIEYSSNTLRKRSIKSELEKIDEWLSKNKYDFSKGSFFLPNMMTYFRFLEWTLEPCKIPTKQKGSDKVITPIKLNVIDDLITANLLNLLLKYKDYENYSSKTHNKPIEFNIKEFLSTFTELKDINFDFYYLSPSRQCCYTYIMECCTLSSFFTNLISTYSTSLRKRIFDFLKPIKEDKSPIITDVLIEKKGKTDTTVKTGTTAEADTTNISSPISIIVQLFTDCISIKGLEQRKLLYTKTIEFLNKYKQFSYSRVETLDFFHFINTDFYPLVANTFTYYLLISLNVKYEDNFDLKKSEQSINKVKLGPHISLHIPVSSDSAQSEKSPVFSFDSGKLEQIISNYIDKSINSDTSNQIIRNYTVNFPLNFNEYSINSPFIKDNTDFEYLFRKLVTSPEERKYLIDCIENSIRPLNAGKDWLYNTIIGENNIKLTL